jgi:hypothetical protein
LFIVGRVAALWLGFVAFDSTWVVLFLIAYTRTPAIARQSSGLRADTWRTSEPAVNVS